MLVTLGGMAESEAAQEAMCAFEECGTEPQTSLFAYIIVTLATLCAVRCWDWLRAATRQTAHHEAASLATRAVESRDVASQAPCTYTAVRGSSHPRCMPLPEHRHG